jgi:hypothetical protein
VQAKSAADDARAAHLKTLGWAPNQMALGSSIQYAICRYTVLDCYQYWTAISIELLSVTAMCIYLLAIVICSDPQSQQKLPQYPNCTISPQNWKTPFCKCGGVYWKISAPCVCGCVLTVCARLCTHCVCAPVYSLCVRACVPTRRVQEMHRVPHPTTNTVSSTLSPDQQYELYLRGE